MALSDTWHRALVYFGLAEEDEPRYESVPDREAEPEVEIEDRYRERPNVRRLQRRAATSSTTSSPTTRPARGPPRDPGAAPGANGNGGDLQVHLVVPKNFNDAQQIADQYKDTIPVILNLQQTRSRPLQASDRLLLGAHLRTRRGHAADRRQGVPAHPPQRGRVGRGAGPPHREGLLQPVLSGGDRRMSVLGSGLAHPHQLDRCPWPAALSSRLMRLGFIGADSMASALARGLGEPAVVSDADSDRAEALVAELGGEAVAGRTRAGGARGPGHPLPQAGLLGEVAERWDAGARRWRRSSPPRRWPSSSAAYPRVPVYRFIPNIPVEVGRGRLRYAPGTRASEGPGRRPCCSLFGRCGVVVRPSMSRSSSRPWP